MNARWFTLGLALLFVACNAQAKTCTITSAAVAFGVYDPAAATLDVTGTLSIHCDGSFNAVLSLGKGTGQGASYGTGRRMTLGGGSDVLIYNLYADSARSRVLGDHTGTSVTLNISGNKDKTQTIWARIPGGQIVSAGTYADTVVATISY
jgi:spore coat protein U-like protein